MICNFSMMYMEFFYLTAYCINIKTHSKRKGAAEGYMRVLIDGVLANSGYFRYDQVVMNNTCYETIENITVQNKNFKQNDNAWEGAITVTYKDEPVALDCINCEGRSFMGLIVVDGDANADNLASTHTYCNNGKACTLKISRKNGMAFSLLNL